MNACEAPRGKATGACIVLHFRRAFWDSNAPRQEAIPRGSSREHLLLLFARATVAKKKVKRAQAGCHVVKNLARRPCPLRSRTAPLNFGPMLLALSLNPPPPPLPFRRRRNAWSMVK